MTRKIDYLKSENQLYAKNPPDRNNWSSLRKLTKLITQPRSVKT